MIAINFTEQELDVLVRLLDIAVKAGGLPAAGAAFILHQKVIAATQDSAGQVMIDPTKQEVVM